MIDIIIPTYNNKEGLINTLASINQNLLDKFTVTVIDDASNPTIDYTDVKKQFPFITLHTLLYNVGPGLARQWGIANTSEPYIMFVDTGDLFISNEIQEEVITEVANNPDEVLFSWPHKIQSTEKLSKEIHNRLHGRVYKRAFLDQYMVSFNLAGSYANEDISFNRYLKIILKSLNKSYKIYSTPLILWTVDENSLTKKDNGVFRFKEQNLGLARNEIYLFHVAKLNHIDEELLTDEANEIIAAMHYNLLQTSELRPEFLQQSWNGAKLFYDNIFKLYINNHQPSLQVCFSNNIKRIRNNKNKKVWKKDLPVNIKRFFSDLEQYQIVPDWYKGNEV